MFKKSKITLALTLALALSLSLLAPVSLADDPPVTQAAITKVLKVPHGTNAPDYDFLFAVDPVSIRGSASLKGLMPKIGTGDEDYGVITINLAEDATEGTGCDCATPCPSDVDHHYKESDDLFDGITWETTGAHEYKIWEIVDTSYNNTLGEAMTFSKAEYKIQVFIKETPDGLEIDTIAVIKTQDDNGDGPEEKVDPTPGDGDENFSLMRFTNAYTKHNGGDGTDPTDTGEQQTLSVAKTVSGEYKSTTMYFDFTMNVTKNSLVPADTKYRVYILGADGVPLDQTDFGNNEVKIGNTLATVGKDANNYGYIEFDFTVTSAPALAFMLKANEKLVFTNAHVGTVYAITEEGSPGYIATATVKIDGGLYYEDTGEMDEGLTIPVSDNVTYPNKTLWIADTTKNNVLFNNDAPDLPITGLDIGDLPFYAMILLALAGLVTFVVLKNRSRKNND